LSIRKIQHNVLNAKQHAREAEIVAEAGQSGKVTIATNMAGRGTDIKLSPESKAAGGLAIIGTERHESRRVDRQLRGRAGRQGDVGSSQFFVSLEDNLMRLFGSDRIAKVMDRLGMDEGEVIQHSMITNSIERAQKKVEENNFGIRKRLLEYDDVMNYQRNAIYKRRQNALLGERLSLDIINILFDVCQDLTTSYSNYEDLELKVIELLGMEPPFSAEEFNRLPVDKRTEQLFLSAESHYKSKNEVIAQQVIQVAQEAKRQGFSGIQVPISNGQMVTGIVVDADKTLITQGKEVISEMEKFITLTLIDQEWKEHLREMDDLKQSVQNAVFEQKDPLLIYKFEAVELFQRFVARVNSDTISFVIKAEIPAAQSTNQTAQKAPKEKAPKLQLSKDEALSSLLGGLAGAQDEPGYHDPSAGQVERVAPRQAIKIADRNQRVTVQYQDGSIKENVKYKAVESDVESGKAVVVA
jgi:preprotein translocase subunit SecA